MKGEEDAEKKESNAMERYTRLVQFFSSPDKTLGELYPFSPYTSQIPLEKCNIPADEQSLSGSDDDFSGSDFSVSQASSGHESPLGRNFLLDDPPARLHLKRRPKRKAEQDGNKDSRQTSAGNQGKQCPESKSTPWNSNLELPNGTTSVADGKRHDVPVSDRDEPPRPPSRRKENCEGGRNRSRDRASPENRKRRRSPEVAISATGSQKTHSASSSRSRQKATVDHSVSTDTPRQKPTEVVLETTTEEITALARDERHRSPQQAHRPSHSHRPRDTSLKESTESCQEKTQISQRPTTEASHRKGHRSHRNASKSPQQPTTDHTLRNTIVEFPQITCDAIRVSDTSCNTPRSSATRHRSSEVHHPNEESYRTETIYSAAEMPPRTTPNFQRRISTEVSHSESPRTPSGNERGENNRERKHLSHSSHHNKRNNSSLEASPPVVIEVQHVSPSVSHTESSNRVRRGSCMDSSPTARSISCATSPTRKLTGQSTKTPSPTSFTRAPTLSMRLISPDVYAIDPPLWSPFETSEESPPDTPGDSAATSPITTPTVSCHRKDVATSPHRESEKSATSTGDKHSKRKTRIFLRDQVESIPTPMGECLTKSIATHKRSSRETPVKQTDESSRRDERATHCSDKGKKSILQVSFSERMTEHTHDEKETKPPTPISKKSTTNSRSARTTHESCPKSTIPTMPTIAEDKTPQSTLELSSIYERTDHHAPNWSGQVSPSWRSSSGSDITEGDSILDIEKFKQTIRSVEVPPELLEPLEESEESDNLLNILETISESPLEDCSEVQNSSYEDQHERHDDVTRNRSLEINTLRRGGGENALDTQRETSGSDISDIQLHYAYGRNKSSDQLELQWIKLEKIVDSASESSDGSIIESPFSRFSMSEELQIRSVNLPNASTAQRHGDADRGPIATYLTLPTQSPATIEDPELAIIVLREDTLSQRQKEVINRFRTGMQHRTRSPTNELSDEVFSSAISRQRSGHPLIIPIADPHAEQGSTTGFAVIADSEPEVPLSVDVDVKSWLAKQKMEETDPLILVNRCTSRGLLDISRTSLSENRLFTNAQIDCSECESKFATLHEWNKHIDSDLSLSKSLIDDELRRLMDNREQDDSSNTFVTHERTESGRCPTNDRQLSQEPVHQERPKTAPPSSEGSKLRGAEISREKQKLGGVPEPQKKRNNTRKNGKDISPDQRKGSSNEMFPGKSSTAYDKPSPERRPVRGRCKTPVNKNGVPNKEDNTVRVLLEPKIRGSKSPKEEPRSPRKCNETDKRNNNNNKSKNKEAEPLSNTDRSQKGPYRSCCRTNTNLPSDKRKPLERPKTAPPGAMRERMEAQREKKAMKENLKTNGKRAQKRSLSAGISTASDVSNKSNDQRRVESNMSISTSQHSSRSGRKTSVPENLTCMKRPQTASPRSENAIEMLPMCESCESTASTDSQGLPRYRLKRNIAYLSEYRKTIDSLRAKCMMKDHMIDTLLEELQRLSPSEETYKRLLMKLSNRRIDGPPPRRDYSCAGVVDLMPSREVGAGEVVSEAEKTAPAEKTDIKCVCPSDFRVAGRVGCDCLLLTWKSAEQYDTVAGYQVDVNGQLSQHVRSPTRTSALLMDLDLTREMRFTLRTLRQGGASPCHPPLEILFAPSSDNWALEDPTKSHGKPP